jgi:MFS family permease
MTAAPSASRIRTWLARWQPLLPLFVAEFVVWLGFGAFLPVLPLYLTSRGIDLATLGLIVAAWPAARLVAEPIFGWIADRTARKPLMVAALIANAILIPLPLVVSGALAFVVLRALDGLATAAYDPAARGFLVDSTPAERQGEAFGLYGAAQMAGLLFGPAIGSFGAGVVGDEAFVFWLASAASFVASLVIAVTVREGRRTRVATGIPGEGVTELQGSPRGAPAEAALGADATGGADMQHKPRRLRNRLLVAAIVLNAGGAFAQGTYEVIWSLFLTSLGATLDLVGATFATFAIPILLFSPLAGRYVDRRGGLPFIVVGTLATIFAGVCYTLIQNPLLALPLILIESTGFAILFPALYAVVAAGSPPGRSSTAQGLFGAAGTVGFIVASLAAGQLATSDIRLPFWMFIGVSLLSLVIGLLIGAGPIQAMRSTSADARADKPRPV